MSEPEIKPLTQAEKDKWLRVLRSGEIKKGRGFFRGGVNKYCALGALHYALGIALEQEKYVPYFHADAKLGRAVADKIWSLNDIAFRDDEDFSRLADWIEANVPATA